MTFLLLCTVAAFLIQLLILLHFQARHRMFRYISLFLLELLPLGSAFYHWIVQPPVPYLGWRFRATMCLWIATAVLIGYLLAWAAYALKRKR